MFRFGRTPRIRMDKLSMQPSSGHDVSQTGQNEVRLGLRPAVRCGLHQGLLLAVGSSHEPSLLPHLHQRLAHHVNRIPRPIVGSDTALCMSKYLHR